MLFVNALAVLSLAASIAGAQPHAHGGHQKLHEKRDVVWTTVTELVTTTVDITTTIWVDEYATSSSSSGSSSSVVAAIPVTTTPTSFTTSTSSSQQPAEFHEETQSTVQAPTVAVPPPARSSSSVFVGPPPSPPPPSSAAAAAAPPPDTPAFVPPTTSTPVVVAPVASSTPPVPAPAAATPPASGGGGSSSSGLPCTSGSPCSGDLTFYDAGLGACGETTDGLVKSVIALPHGMMGAQSNGNPFCGKTVSITKGTKTIIATVVDKCMGCDGNSIDLSRHAWVDLGLDEGTGRTQGTWFFN